MADLLETGSNWLASTFKSHVSQSITYTRGASSVSISATIGTRQLSMVDGGAELIFTETDFVFLAADLTFGAGAVDPEEGDTITVTIGGKAITHEVMNVAGGKHFQFDPYRKTVRVHTKQTAVA